MIIFIVSFLIGNKCDLFGEEQVSEKEGSELASKMNAVFLLVSAKDDTNMSLIPKLIVENCLKKFGNFKDWNFKAKKTHCISSDYRKDISRSGSCCNI